VLLVHPAKAIHLEPCLAGHRGSRSTLSKQGFHRLALSTERDFLLLFGEAVDLSASGGQSLREAEDFFPQFFCDPTTWQIFLLFPRWLILCQRKITSESRPEGTEPFQYVALNSRRVPDFLQCKREESTRTSLKLVICSPTYCWPRIRKSPLALYCSSRSWRNLRRRKARPFHQRPHRLMAISVGSSCTTWLRYSQNEQSTGARVLNALPET